jgi:hypothetical protein
MGLFSKIFGGIKKAIRGVGKVIKKVTKPIRKVLRKILKPIGKVFNKLGFVGTLALSFLLPPGFGQVISNWFGTMGNALMTGITKVAPNFAATVGEFIANIGTTLSTTATRIGESSFGKGVSHIFNTITDGIKSGVNAIAKPFGFDPTVAGGRSFTDAFSQGLDNLMGKTTTDVAGGTLPTGSYFDPVNKMYIDETTGKAVSGEWWKQRASDIALEQGQAVINEAGNMVSTDTGGLMSRFNTGVKNFKDTTAVQFASNVAQGKSIYDKYTYEEPTYFRNNALDDAAGLIQQAQITSQTPIDALSFSGEPLQAQDNFYSLASKYIAGAGYAQPSQGTDLFNFANNLPGYGYQFANFLEDSLYDSAGFAATNYTEQAIPKGGY